MLTGCPLDVNRMPEDTPTLVCSYSIVTILQKKIPAEFPLQAKNIPLRLLLTEKLFQ